MRPSSLVAATVLAGLLGLAAVPASAVQIKATSISSHPKIFLWVEMLSDVFIPATNKALEDTGDSIVWTEAYGGTLAKAGSVLETMEAGLAEVGIVSSIFNPSQLPLQNVTYATPFGSPDVNVVLNAINEMHAEIPEMRRLWEAHDLEYLGVGLGIDDYFLMTKKPVRHLADLQGLKIGAPGPAVNWLEGTGAVGVSGNLTTFYNALQTGGIDGVITFSTAAAAAGFYEQAKYITMLHFGAQCSGAIVARKSWYDALPPRVQAALQAGAQAMRQAARARMQARKSSALSKMKAGGAVFITVPESERSAWANALPNLPFDWAHRLDAKGLAGSKVAKAYLAKLRAAGTSLPRDWAAK